MILAGHIVRQSFIPKGIVFSPINRCFWLYLKKTEKSVIFAIKNNIMACKHLNIKVTGKVQGVWFRKYTKDQADVLQLNGTVQNMPDGSVYVEVESTDDSRLNRFLEWLQTGSPLSRVDDVVQQQGEKCVGYKGFEIIR